MARTISSFWPKLLYFCLSLSPSLNVHTVYTYSSKTQKAFNKHLLISLESSESKLRGFFIYIFWLFVQEWKKVYMSLRSEIKRPSSAVTMPLAALSCSTWVVIFYVPLLKYSLSIREYYLHSPGGWRESGFIVGQPKLPENLLKLFWEVSGKFSKHS